MASYSEFDGRYVPLPIPSQEAVAVAQAQGKLMGRFMVTPEEALDLLAMAAELDGLTSYEVTRILVTNRQWCS